MSLEYREYCEETGVDPKDKKAFKDWRKDTRDWGESLTEQQHKETCDINNIINKYDREGFIGHINEAEPMFLDVSGDNLRRSVEVVDNLRTEFMKLGPEERFKFNNDPIAYGEWLARPEKAETHASEVYPTKKEEKAAEAFSEAPEEPK